MQKTINFEKGTLIIGYCDNSQDVSIFLNGEFTEPITFTFIPLAEIQMTEKSCVDYTKEIMPLIINEAKILISKNKEFYRNFEIDFLSRFAGFNLDRHVLDRDLLIVRKSWMRLISKLIESENILIN